MVSNTKISVADYNTVVVSTNYSAHSKERTQNQDINDAFLSSPYNIVKSPNDARDWTIETCATSNNTVKSIQLPRNYDLRRNMLPIRSQGRQGACAAFSAACMREYHERREWNCKRYFSPQYIYNNRSNQQSSGMFLRDVMKILHKKGCCFEDEYKYLNKIEKPEEICDETNIKASNFRIKAYARINTIDGLKKSLIQNGPALIAVPVYNKGSRMWLKSKRNTKCLGGHCMAVVGYDEDGFIVRNSWGRYWGVKGYTIFPYEDWSCHWECWTAIDAKTIEPDNNSDISTDIMCLPQKYIPIITSALRKIGKFIFKCAVKVFKYFSK